MKILTNNKHLILLLIILLIVVPVFGSSVFDKFNTGFKELSDKFYNKDYITGNVV